MSEEPPKGPQAPHEHDPFPKMILWVIAATLALFMVIAIMLFVDFIQRAQEGTEHPLGRPPVELFDDLPPARLPHTPPE